MKHVAGRGDQGARRCGRAPGRVPLPRFCTVGRAGGDAPAASVVGELNARATGWRRSATTAIPYKGDGIRRRPRPATSRRRTSATRPTRRRIPDPKLMGISIEAYVRNMGVLIRALGRPTMARCVGRVARAGRRSRGVARRRGGRRGTAAPRRRRSSGGSTTCADRRPRRRGDRRAARGRDRRRAGGRVRRRRTTG